MLGVTGGIEARESSTGQGVSRLRSGGRISGLFPGHGQTRTGTDEHGHSRGTDRLAAALGYKIKMHPLQPSRMVSVDRVFGGHEACFALVLS